jgi:hypothetical protein
MATFKKVELRYINSTNTDTWFQYFTFDQYVIFQNNPNSMVEEISVTDEVFPDPPPPQQGGGFDENTLFLHGTAEIGVNETITITLPESFANTNYSVQVSTGLDSTEEKNDTISAEVIQTTKTTGSFVVRSRWTTFGSTEDKGIINWLAVGDKPV